jgi:hypothetical protein
MHEINLLDETFVKNQSHHYNLSIQTGLNGLSFSILDFQNLKYVGLRNYFFDNVDNPNEIAPSFTNVFQKEELLRLNYKSVSHIYVGGGSTLVPAKYFDEQQINDIYKLNFSVSGNHKVMYNALDSGNILNIFSYPETLLKVLNDHFPQCKLYHHSTPFLQNVITESAHLTRPRCYSYLYKGLMTIAIADNKQIIFYNTFIINSITDIVYYLLSVYEQFSMTPKHSDLFVSSDTDEHDEIFENLNKYFKNLRFIIPSKQFTYSYLFDELYLTRYANLFNVALCE